MVVALLTGWMIRAVLARSGPDSVEWNTGEAEQERVVVGVELPLGEVTLGYDRLVDLLVMKECILSRAPDRFFVRSVAPRRGFGVFGTGARCCSFSIERVCSGGQARFPGAGHLSATGMVAWRVSAAASRAQSVCRPRRGGGGHD